jgi:hypothetical protein
VQPVPGWQWLVDIGLKKPHRCISVGFLVQDDGQIKVIAPNLGASDGDEDWDQASGTTSIPTAAVPRVERLTFSAASCDRDAA